MTWDGATRRILFVVGMFCGVEAGRLFYLDRPSAGGAFLLLTGMFLFFSQRERREPQEEPYEEERRESASAALDLAFFAAEEALNGLKRIGRTMPPSPMEIAQLEDRLELLLGRLGASAEERARLAEEFEKLRGRARLDEGRRALSQSSRL